MDILQNLEKRLLRLTWNDQGWEKPCAHKWRKSNQGNSNIAFENQYGFGGEEWLFNSRYGLDGYQYGYIRGVKNLSESIEVINEAYLFTIQPKTGNRYLVGIIKELEIIIGYEPEEAKAKILYKKYIFDVKEELIAAGADLKGIDAEEFLATIRFKVTGNELFEHPTLIPGLRGHKYNRFQPYVIDSALEKIIHGHLPSPAFSFNNGIARNSNSFKRTGTTLTRTILRVHSDITEALIQYLKPSFSSKLNNISVEKTYFGENIADIVLKNIDGSFSLIEVKTSNNTRKNIREALGQLLDYAFWYKTIAIKNLVIVSPSPLEGPQLNSLLRIKRSLNIEISYWQYIVNTDSNKKQFKEVLLT